MAPALRGAFLLQAPRAACMADCGSELTRPTSHFDKLKVLQRTWYYIAVLTRGVSYMAALAQDACNG